LLLPEGKKDISVGSIFKNGQALKDTYSGNTTEVINGKVSLDTPYTLVLLEAN